MNTPQPPLALEAVVIESEYFETLALFYQNALGLPQPRRHGDTHLGFQLEKIYLGFDKIEANDTYSIGRTCLWFLVEDLEASLTRLLEHGAALHIKPHDSEDKRETYAVVLDPESNQIGLLQRNV